MEYGELVQCFSSIVLILLTAVLAVETRLLRKAETEPSIILYLRPCEANYFLIELVLENAGKGVGNNILVELDHDLTMSSGKTISSVGFLNGVSVLAPGQKLVSYIDSVKNPENLTGKLTEGTVSYCCERGKLHIQHFCLNFDELVSVESSFSPDLSMADSLERIAAAIGRDPYATNETL